MLGSKQKSRMEKKGLNPFFFVIADFDLFKVVGKKSVLGGWKNGDLPW